MSLSLDVAREVADSPLCWTVTNRNRSCPRRGVARIWWNDIHPRVLVCAQHAKGKIPAKGEIQRRVRERGQS